MINHGLTTGALFACVGVIYERYHTREMDEMGGLWNRLPLLAFFLILASLGSAAVARAQRIRRRVPDPAGHVLASRADGRARRHAAWSWGPTTCSGCSRGWSSARFTSPSMKTIRLRPRPTSQTEVRPVGWHEIAGLAPLMVLIVVIGVLPGPFLDRIRPSVGAIDRNLQDQRGSMKIEPPPSRPRPDPA